MVLKVKNPGLYTTVQDLGRYGHQAEGFSPAGAMDYRAFMLANQLLGNDENAPGLEMTLQGASFEVMKDTVIAAAGADMVLKVDGEEFSTGVPIPVFKGSLIEFGAAEDGSRTYLGSGRRLQGGARGSAVPRHMSEAASAAIMGVRSRREMSSVPGMRPLRRDHSESAQSKRRRRSGSSPASSMTASVKRCGRSCSVKAIR